MMIVSRLFAPLSALFLAAALISLFPTDHSSAQSAAPVKVTVGVPTPSVPFLPPYVAIQKGFDRANGIEIELRTIPGSVGVQSMVSGGIDFTTSAGSVLNAGLAGAPVRVLMIMIDKSTYTVYARPEIKGIQDLKGKRIAVDSIGGSQYSELLLGFKKIGFNPSDVAIVGLSPSLRVASLESGAIAASMVAPPQDLTLEKLGYNRILRLGDHVVGINGGIGVSTALLQSKPALVDNLVTAALMGLRTIKENRAASLPLIMSYLNVDAGEAALIYDNNVQAFSDGKSSLATRAEMVAAAAAALKSSKGLQPADIFELGPLDRAYARLQAGGWRAQ